MKRRRVLPLFSCLFGFLLLPSIPAQRAGKAAALGESAFLRGLTPPGGPRAGASGSPSSGLDGPFQASRKYQSNASMFQGGKRLDVLVEIPLYPYFSKLFQSLFTEMEREGWAVTEWDCRGGTPAEVRAFLKNRFNSAGIRGCLIVGDLPVPWFEMDDDFFLRHAEFPCDLYYMDLDGTWTDKDKDGIFDGHGPSAKGDERPEIFVGRIKPLLSSMSTYAAVGAYLKKDLDYRKGKYKRLDRALSFRDDLWAHLDTGQSRAWSRVDVIKDPYATNAAGWKAALQRDYASAVLCAESDERNHFFQVPGKAKESVTSQEILPLSSGVLFLNLFGARCGRYTEKDYLGEAYLFGGRGGLGVTASTKDGSMAFFGDYYAALGRGASLGEAFLDWFRKRYPYGREQVRWFYGMTLLGDPTLRIDFPAMVPLGPGLPKAGGKVEIEVQGPRWDARRPYLVLGSFSQAPGSFYLPGVRVPIPYNFSVPQFLLAAGSPLLPGWFGVLDAGARARAGITWNGPLPPVLWGRRVYLSCLFPDPGGMTAARAVDVGIGREKFLVEFFLTSANRDPYGSGAGWAGGKLVPGLLGGSGILGDFDYRVGSTKVGEAYVFDTSHTPIPGTRTLDGKDHLVKDGVYRFASFRIPKGVTVRFEGPYPAKIFVVGTAEIAGTLDLSGRTPVEVAKWNSKLEAGVPGGKGGAGGAAGGEGGSEPGRGTPEGKNGGDMLVPPGHPKKGKEVGTGGKGSAENPPKLDPKKVTLDYYTVSCIQLSFPAGGGGSATPGGLGSLRQKPGFFPKHGAPVAASKSFPFLPLVSSMQVLPQLLLGGAGGGGAGVCPWGSFSVASPTWNRGNGGGGGGGALALRCGWFFLLRPTGSILAVGGTGGGAGASSGSGLAPGGGGAGGTVLLQAGKFLSFQGTLDVRGGPSLRSQDLYNTVDIISAKGGDGYYRAEAVPAPNPSSITQAFPSPTSKNVGLLTDRDAVTGARSRFMGDTLSGAISLAGFVLETRENGKKVLYSDDPSKGILPVFGKTPVAFFLQGGASDRFTVRTRWVTSSKAFNHPSNWLDPKVPPASVRWTILLDTSRLPSPAMLEVRKVEVTYAY